MHHKISYLEVAAVLTLVGIHGYGCYWMSKVGILLQREIYGDFEFSAVTNVALSSYLWAPYFAGLIGLTYFFLRLRMPEARWLFWVLAISLAVMTVGIVYAITMPYGFTTFRIDSSAQCF